MLHAKFQSPNINITTLSTIYWSLSNSVGYKFLGTVWLRSQKWTQVLGKRVGDKCLKSFVFREDKWGEKEKCICFLCPYCLQPFKHLRSYTSGHINTHLGLSVCEICHVFSLFIINLHMTWSLRLYMLVLLCWLTTSDVVGHLYEIKMRTEAADKWKLKLTATVWSTYRKKH